MANYFIKHMRCILFTILLGVNHIVFAQVPANDNCSGAVSLNVNSGTNCTTSTSGTSANASQSQIGCAGNADDDVWFSFTATATTHTITVTPGTMNNAVLELFYGTCASLTSFGCINGTGGTNTEVANLSSLSIGTTYLVRVYSNGNNTNTGTFSVCVTTPAPPPANDNCSGCLLYTSDAADE